ncbi:hypothetical protein ARMSODRAFT_965131 [Armillaria solidipes]|uniref:Carboxylesterase type B domain-containing protein n=1 Tax=Armillaria solidipes TaxID=1076256 RepID=A0A2H3ARD3_9AGAR|nr:hypothetical protein ARMSODRAFT_965131 [Armillaria solidipes]
MGRSERCGFPGMYGRKGAQEHVDGLVSLWIHGGEYMMGNGSEYFGECGIVDNIQELEYSQVKYIVFNQLSKIVYYMNPVTPQNCWTPILTYSVVCKIAEDCAYAGGTSRYVTR